MARTPLAILVALLALAPSVLAGYGDLDATDPSGDETAGLAVVAFVPIAACDASAVDILAYRLRVEGGDLVASMDVADAAAPMVCGGTPLGPPTRGHWSVILSPRSFVNGSGVWHVSIAVHLADAGTVAACYDVDTRDGRGRACDSLPTSDVFVGSTWTWSVPLQGTVRAGNGSAPYDLTGEDYDAEAIAFQAYPVGPFSPAYGYDATGPRAYSL